MKVKMRVNVRRWEMHRDGEGIAVVPSCSLNTFWITFFKIERNPTGFEMEMNRSHIEKYMGFSFIGVAVSIRKCKAP